jgi:hypothetical protein
MANPLAFLKPPAPPPPQLPPPPPPATTKYSTVGEVEKETVSLVVLVAVTE